MKKRVITFTIAFIILLSSFTPAFGEEPLPVKLYGDAAVVADLTTGDILYVKNADEKRYPASLTKMMTCILALENLDLGQTVTVDPEASGIEGSSLKLKTGEKITAKDLIYATMIVSGNDGAMALAKAVCGASEDFVVKMNKKAEELGCTGTHFSNPHGLHDEDHYTTARDMTKIALYCMKNETFRDIVSTVNYEVPQTNMSSKRNLTTSNWLLNDTVENHMVYVGSTKRYCKYEGCIGIKTGSTSKAGNCLVAAAAKDGTSILAVSMNAPNTYERFADGIALLDLGLANFNTISPFKLGMELGTIKVRRGSVKTVTAVLDDTVYATLKKEEDASIITSEVVLSERVDAPISEGAIIGSVSVYKSGELLGVYDAVAANTVEKGGPLSIFGIDDAAAAKIGKILLIILIIILVLFAALVIWVILEKRRIRKKKERKAARLRAKQERENLNRSYKEE